MSAKRKAVIASVISAVVLVLFPTVGDSIALLINTLVGFVPQLTLRQ